MTFYVYDSYLHTLLYKISTKTHTHSQQYTFTNKYMNKKSTYK